jgi:membrane-associated phospholipid phosphatase
MKKDDFSNFFYKLPQNLGEIFQAKNLVWHALAIILTFICVVSDFDWKYYSATQIASLRPILFFAVILGFFLPFILPLILLIIGKAKKNLQLLNTAYTLAQAAGLAWLTSAIYKSLTGRPGPAESLNNLGNISMGDISHIFKFGFLRGGIAWGWPSSHTAVAFAMSACLFVLYPEKKFIKYLGLIYAIYIGISVSMTIHWFSDFLAGIIFGSLAGLVVGKSFLERYKKIKTI